MEWNKIHTSIRNSASCNVFRRVILKFIKPEPNQVFDADSSEGLKCLARIRLELSHLVEGKFRPNFQRCVNTIRSCG